MFSGGPQGGNPCSIPFSSFSNATRNHPPSAPAAYAAGWFASVSKAKINVSSTKGFGPGLQAIRMTSEEETITFERTGAECARFSSSTGRQRSYSYAEPSLYSLLHQELSILGEDRMFNAAFSRAGEFVR